MNQGGPETDVVLAVGASPDADRLVAAGFDVERASGTRAVRERLGAGGVDCVVAGHDPPAVDGLALAQRLDGRRPGLPVVLRPADGSEALASEAVAAGVSAYVPSDGGSDRLVSAVERAVGAARERGDRGLAYREVFDSVDAGLTVRDAATGELLDVNRHYCDLLGCSRAEAMELTLEAVTADLPGYDAERGRELLRRAVEEPGFTFEWPDRRPDGEVVWVEVNATETTIEGRDRLLVTVRDVSDRRERERALETLHAAAARFGKYESVEAVCEATVEAADEVLDLGMSTVLVAEGEWLVPKALSADAPGDEARRMRTDQGLAGRTFRTGESSLVEDVAEDPDADPADEDYRSGLSVPVGETAVFQAVAVEPDAFDESDVELAELLVTHTARALDRLRFEAELRRQNERLEEFAGVVSHDLRNPLNVAQARLELVREEREAEDPNLEAVSGALSRMDAIIDDTLTLAREGRAAVEPEPVDLATFAGRCWRLVGTGDVAIETGDTFALRADLHRLQSLFENLFRNSVEHGSTSNRTEPDDAVEHGSGSRQAEPDRSEAGEAAPTVRVGAIGREGFYVEDDGPGIPETDRERVFETGYTTGSEGTGFGLAIVEEVVEGHGWEISVTESDAGGARFEVTGVDPAD